MRGRRGAVVILIFLLGLGSGVIAKEQSNSQNSQQKSEKKTAKSSDKTSQQIQPFQPSKEVSADSVISLPTDI